MTDAHAPSAVRLLPVTFQALRDQALPTQRSLARTKWFWRAKEGRRIWFRSLYAPFLSTGALFGFLTVPIFLFFVFALFGEKAVIERSQFAVTTLLAAIFTFPAWAVLNAIATPFRVIAAEGEVGAWDGARFIYLEQKLLSTSEFRNEGGPGEAIFHVNDIPAGAVIDYRIEIEGPAERLNCILFGASFIAPISEMIKTTRFAPQGRVVLRKDNSLRLICYSQPGTIPAQIRVYASLGRSIPRSRSSTPTNGVRIVIRPPGHEDAPATDVSLA